MSDLFATLATTNDGTHKAYDAATSNSTSSTKTKQIAQQASERRSRPFLRSWRRFTGLAAACGQNVNQLSVPLFAAVAAAAAIAAVLAHLAAQSLPKATPFSLESAQFSQASQPASSTCCRRRYCCWLRLCLCYRCSCAAEPAATPSQRAWQASWPEGSPGHLIRFGPTRLRLCELRRSFGTRLVAAVAPDERATGALGRQEEGGKSARRRRRRCRPAGKRATIRHRLAGERRNSAELLKLAPLAASGCCCCCSVGFQDSRRRRQLVALSTPPSSPADGAAATDFGNEATGLNLRRLETQSALTRHARPLGHAHARAAHSGSSFCAHGRAEQVLSLPCARLEERKLC